MNEDPSGSLTSRGSVDAIPMSIPSFVFVRLVGPCAFANYVFGGFAPPVFFVCNTLFLLSVSAGSRL